MSYLQINSTDISKHVKTLQFGHEPVWNTQAGRTITAKFQGRIVARKWTLSIGTKPLSQSEAGVLGNLITKGDFVTAKFVNPYSASGELVTKTFYVSSSAVSVYSYAAELGKARYQTMTFELIEQ